jgi:hypothetical protein
MLLSIWLAFKIFARGAKFPQLLFAPVVVSGPRLADFLLVVWRVASQIRRRDEKRLCCTDRLVDVLSPPHGFRLGDADGLRASELKHAVQGMNYNGGLSSATLVGPRAQRITDHSVQPADGSFHQSPTRVPGPLLPALASMLRDWRCRSRWVGVLSAVSVSTAVDRGGTITSASG